MRRVATSTLLALALAAGLVVPGIARTALTGAASARFPASTRSHTSARVAAPERASGKTRTWSLRLMPAPEDFVLAQIRFAPGYRRAVDRALSHIEPQAPFGSDYLAVATPSARLSAGGPQGLILLVDRPSALEDPASVKLRLSAAGPLADREVRRVDNPFAEPPAPAARHGLCDLATRGHALQTSDLTPLRSVGAPLDGSGVAAAVSQAYDVACGLPYESAFKQAVTGVSTQPQPPQPTPAPPQPQPTPPTPAPVPPVGKDPGEGCIPTPGYACPAALQSGPPVAAPDTDRRAAAGA